MGKLSFPLSDPFPMAYIEHNSKMFTVHIDVAPDLARKIMRLLAVAILVVGRYLDFCIQLF
jgi:hypothetical protein